MPHSLSDTLVQQLQGMGTSNTAHLAAVRESLEAQQTQSRQAIEQLQQQVRQTLEQQIQSLQPENAKKLDEMRATVDEKLQTTLEARLGESFKQVADRLEQVHKGLGEMQTLAQGVGDLKHLLTNVKTRGMFGEAQLASLLEQVMATEQYAAQVATRPGSKNVVDFAIRLPGRGDNGAPCWLPIVIIGLMTTYQALLDHNMSHTWMLFPFGWARHGDWSDIAASRAPLPLLVQYDIHDDLFPEDGMREAHMRLHEHIGIWENQMPTRDSSILVRINLIWRCSPLRSIG